MHSVQHLFEDQIKDLYSAEKQLIKALPKMAKAASNSGLKEAFQSHLEETKGQVERLDKVASICGFKPTGKTCAAMEGLVKEGEEVIEEDGDANVKDLALAAAAQRVEHYEIAGYGNARFLAKLVGKTECSELLQQTLDEEGAADKKLSKICQGGIAEAAPKTADARKAKAAG